MRGHGGFKNMLLGKFYEGLELSRGDKIICARLTSPHAVLSTSRANGGYREDLLYVFNHQACEPSGHGGGKAMLGYTDPDRYLADVCAHYGIGPASRCASLSTAANMRLCDVKSLSYKDLTVVAAATAGVESNAGRAGDPASGYEGRDGYEAIPRWKKALEDAHRLPSARAGAAVDAASAADGEAPVDAASGADGEASGGEGESRRTGGQPTGTGSRATGTGSRPTGTAGQPAGSVGQPTVTGGQPAGTGGRAAGDAGAEADAAPCPDDPSELPPHGTINILVFVNLPLTP
ncbi:MAG: adenosylcobinamide amidohydrolase, partial [Deltaproteobacteria bacterium]|nr:adenosylcobinamide amidohydrolase [Deltaproteobacteria bacterium]